MIMFADWMDYCPKPETLNPINPINPEITRWWDFYKRRWSTLWLMRTMYNRYKSVLEPFFGILEEEGFRVLGLRVKGLGFRPGFRAIVHSDSSKLTQFEECQDTAASLWHRTANENTCRCRATKVVGSHGVCRLVRLIALLQLERSAHLNCVVPHRGARDFHSHPPLRPNCRSPKPSARTARSPKRGADRRPTRRTGKRGYLAGDVA